MKREIMVLLSRLIPSVCFTSYHATTHAKYLFLNSNGFFNVNNEIKSLFAVTQKRKLITSRGGGEHVDSTSALDMSTTSSAATDAEVESVAEKCKNICSSLEVSEFGKVPFISTDFIFPKHRVLFVLGGPGAGKGTQSERIVAGYKSCHLSVGELLRSEGPRSEHADLIESCLVSGSIVPVEISLSLLRQAMDREATNSPYGDKIFLVDGFPRNFDNLLGWSQTMPPYTTLLGALIFDCPEHILEQRILNRGKTSGRSDDNLASARKRFKTYETQTRSVICALEKMQREDKLCQVHHIVGDKTIDEVWDQVQEIMNSFVKNDILTKTQKLLIAIEAKDYKTYKDLCHEDMFHGKDASMMEEDVQLINFFEENELIQRQKTDDTNPDGEVITSNPNQISNIEFEVFQGTKAVITYDRIVVDDDKTVLLQLRESRAWNHGPNGWKQVHFSREPFI